jgi:hypothetical protein
MTDPAWRRWTLLALLTLLGCGYIVAFTLFVTRSGDFIFTQRNDLAAQFSAAHPLDVPGELRFGADRADNRHLGGGWNGADDNGVWSQSNEAALELSLRPVPGIIELRFGAYTYISARTKRNRADISINGQTVASVQRDNTNAGEPIVVRWRPPPTARAMLHVRLHVRHCRSPKREGLSPDARSLCLLLNSVQVVDTSTVGTD